VLRALPTLLRVGVAETVAYRAELIVWVLTLTLPLVMLALWTSVASEGPFRGFSSEAFVAYYLATLITRNLTSSWVSWQISEEVRLGTIAMRLLRPVPPFVALAASHVAALPLRSLVALPVAVALLLSSGASALTREPLQLALVAPSLALAWLIAFGLMFTVGALAFFVTRASGLFSAYFTLYVPLSGYLMPLELLPGWLRAIAEVAPFRYTLAVPVELMTRPLDPGAAWRLVLGQVLWAAASLALAAAVWRRGVRRFEAVGG
jgi:ABC-2 type transport system permease protein